MARFILGVLLIGPFWALVEVDTVAKQVFAWTETNRPPGRTADRARRETDSVARPTGFRTTHVVVPMPRASRYVGLIERYSAESAVRPELVTAVIQAESGFDPLARSPVGAMGLMQLMPRTAAELGVTDPYDPEENIRGGTTYLKHLLTRYDGNEVVALAAYNADPGVVDRYGHRALDLPRFRGRVRTWVSSTLRQLSPLVVDG